MTALGLHATIDLAPTLTPTSARILTDRIRARLTDLKQLVLTAYEGQIHAALGYASWEAYVDGELNISRSHSYRLLESARVERALTDLIEPDGVAVSSGDKIKPLSLPEALTRGLDVDAAISTVKARLNGHAGDPQAALALFREVADEMRRQPPEPDETATDIDSRHVTDVQITQITDPMSGGAAYLWESTTGWNRGWALVVRTGDPRDVLNAWAEVLSRYRRHLRGEVLEGSELSVARARAATHDPVDWQGPLERGGVKGWLAPSGHFYPEAAVACRKMLAKRRALGLPT